LLRIAPNPASEIDERPGETVRLCITLLLFFGATLMVAWLVADRARAPVSKLETSLPRLAAGDADAVLPAFTPRVFSRAARWLRPWPHPEQPNTSSPARETLIKSDSSFPRRRESR
jgi:hypothetical protein